MVLWLVVVFVGLTLVRLAVTALLADSSGALSVADVSRLRLADVGLALVALGVATSLVTQRFHGAMSTLMETTERVDTAVTAAENQAAESRSSTLLVARAVSHATKLARRADTAEPMTPAEIRALSQSVLRVSDISTLSGGRVSEESDRFGLRQLVTRCVDGVANGDVSVALSIDAAVPNGLRGDVERLDRALTALLEAAASDASTGALSLRVNGTRSSGKVDVTFSIWETGIATLAGDRAASSSGALALPPDVQVVAAMAERIGGTVRVSRRDSGAPAFELSAPFGFNAADAKDDASEWKPRSSELQSRNDANTQSAVLEAVGPEAVVSETPVPEAAKRVADDDGLDAELDAAMDAAMETAPMASQPDGGLPPWPSGSVDVPAFIPSDRAPRTAGHSPRTLLDDSTVPLEPDIRAALLANSAADVPSANDLAAKRAGYVNEAASQDDAETGVWRKTEDERNSPPTMRIHPAEEPAAASPRMPIATGARDGVINDDTIPVPKLLADASGWSEGVELMDSGDLMSVSGSVSSWTVRDTQLVDVVPESSSSTDAPLFAGPGVYGVEPSPRVERTDGSTPVVQRSDDAHTVARERRVLVVDDDAMARWSLTGQLSLFGYSVDAVAGGKAALEALSKRSYDAVLLDTYMPDMNGFETAARIRATSGSRVPIIALSDIDSAAERARCEAAGIDEFVKKPFDGEALAAVVDQLVTARRSTESGAFAPDGLDPEVLQRLEGIQTASEQPDLVQRMVGTFIERAENAFTAFDLGFDEADPALIRVTAERLRRSCATLGAVTMEEISGQVSSALAQGDLDGAKPLVSALEAEFARVRPALLARV